MTSVDWDVAREFTVGVTDVADCANPEKDRKFLKKDEV